MSALDPITASTPNQTVEIRPTESQQVQNEILHPSHLWISFVVSEMLMLLASIYIFIIKLYQVLARKSRKSIWKAKDGKSKKLQMLIFFTLMLYSLAAIGKYSLAQIIAFTASDPSMCSVFAKAHRALHIAGVILFSLFLWLRQRILYLISHLKHLASPSIVWWNWITLLIILVSAVSGFAVVLSPIISSSRYGIKNETCYNLTSNFSLSALAGVISSVIVNVSLLILFVRFVVWRPTTTNVSPQLRRTKMFVRRCCVVACICMSTDILAFILVALIKGNVPELATIIVLDVDQFLNLVCILVCFVDWKTSIFPWSCHRQQHLPPSNTISNQMETKATSEFQQ